MGCRPNGDLITVDNFNDTVWVQLVAAQAAAAGIVAPAVSIILKMPGAARRAAQVLTQADGIDVMTVIEAPGCQLDAATMFTFKLTSDCRPAWLLAAYGPNARLKWCVRCHSPARVPCCCAAAGRRPPPLLLLLCLRICMAGIML